MKIIQVMCNGITLSVGDTIKVKFKPLEGDNELPEVEKNIEIASFRPYEDTSEDIWIVDKDGEIFADENFVCKINK